MAEPSGSPIIILSEEMRTPIQSLFGLEPSYYQLFRQFIDDDDDDDDVVLVKEEKINPQDDDDVVFISRTPATPTATTQSLNSDQPTTMKELAAKTTSAVVSSSGDITFKFSTSEQLTSMDPYPLDLSNHYTQNGSCISSNDSSSMNLKDLSETETGGIYCKEFTGDTVSADLCKAYLKDSSDASSGRLDVSSSNTNDDKSSRQSSSPQGLSAKSSSFKNLMQSSKSGLLGGSMDALSTVPTCLSCRDNKPVYSKVENMRSTSHCEITCTRTPTASGIKNTNNSMLNLDDILNNTVNSSSDLLKSLSNDDKQSAATPSLNIPLPSASFVQKSANLPNNNCDQTQSNNSATVPQSLSKPVNPASLDILQNLYDASQQVPSVSSSQFDMSGNMTTKKSDAYSSFLTNASASVGSASSVAVNGTSMRKRCSVASDNDDFLCVKVARSAEVCVLCKMSLVDLKVSRCTQGHPVCGSCLEGQVKLILTDKQGSLECIKDMCNSYYPMSELKNALPSLVVDILEDKLHKDYINFISDMMMTNDASSGRTKHPDAPIDHSGLNFLSSSGSSVEPSISKGVSVNSMSDPGSEYIPSAESVPDKNNDLPSHWYPMDKNTNLLIVELQPESEEYVDIAIKFHQTMLFPTVADIAKIYRVQNPILWKYYSLKKMEMVHENDCHEIDVRSLFHGTTNSVVEAICRKGFDWRVCGKHGCVYGQGCYFARAASYSHQYTDQIKGYARQHMTNSLHHLQSLFAAAAAASSQSLVPKQCSPVSAPFLSSVPPPAHMKFASQKGPLVQTQNTNIGRQIYRIYGPVNINNSQPPVSVPVKMPSRCISASADLNSSHGSLNQTTNMSYSVGSFFLNCALMLDSRKMQNSISQSNSTSTTMTTSTTPTVPSSNTPYVRQHSDNTPKKDTKEQVVSLSDIVNAPTRKMFLANVLVGKYTGGKSCLRKPPPLYPANPYGKSYDSCVDDIFDPKIVVIFDSNQAYPEYIIEYNYSGDC